MENDFTDSSSVKNIRVLVLNYCGVTWELVEKIKVSFSCLSELHLMTNRIKAMMVSVSSCTFFCHAFYAYCFIYCYSSKVKQKLLIKVFPWLTGK
jgi:hypothetical protein